MKRFATLISLLLLFWSCQESGSSDYSLLYASKGTHKVVNTKIVSEEWAKVSYTKLRNRIDPYVERHIADYITFERLLIYYTNIGDKESATKMASIIAQAINNGTYSRDNSNWVGLMTQEPLKSKDERVEQGDIS